MTPSILTAAREVRALLDVTRLAAGPCRTLHQQRLNRAVSDLTDQIEAEARAAMPVRVLE